MSSTTFCPSCGAEYLPGVTQCVDCQIPIGGDAPEPGDEVVYDLSEWGVEDRNQVDRLLTAANLTHRWEVASDLVILEADVDAVELVLDEVEASGGAAPLAAIDDDADDGGDEETYAVMSGLFVAADRLKNDPGDAAVAGEFYLASDKVAVTSAPFGIDRPVWQQVQELAASLAAAMETDVDDDVISRDAAALRSLLSRYV